MADLFYKLWPMKAHADNLSDVFLIASRYGISMDLLPVFHVTPRIRRRAWISFQNRVLLPSPREIETG